MTPGRRSRILEERGPLALRARSWRAVLARTRRGVFDQHLSLVAAGSAFFAMLALAPALTALVSVWALFADPGRIADQLALLDRVLPHEAYALIVQQMQRIAATAHGSLGWSAALSLALMLWAANQGTRAFMTAFNIVYGERETRGPLAVGLYSLLLTALGVVVTAIALALVAGLPPLLTALGFPQHEREGLGLLRWPVLLAGMLAFYLLLGRFAPSRKPPPWRWLWPGAAASALAWLVASAVFSVYVALFGAFDAVYGSLGAIVVLLLWIYLSIFVGLIGAKMNAELERETLTEPGARRDGVN